MVRPVSCPSLPPQSRSATHRREHVEATTSVFVGVATNSLRTNCRELITHTSLRTAVEYLEMSRVLVIARQHGLRGARDVAARVVLAHDPPLMTDRRTTSA